MGIGAQRQVNLKKLPTLFQSVLLYIAKRQIILFRHPVQAFKGITSIIV